MGTTSQKLEYLNGTKNSLKSAINNLGGAIDSNTTFRAYASELDTIYDNLPKVSDTGTNVSLSPTLKGRLGIVPKGNTYQESTTGKNLFDVFSNVFLGSASAKTPIISSDGKITSEANYATARGKGMFVELESNTTYTLSFNIDSFTASTGTARVFIEGKIYVGTSPTIDLFNGTSYNTTGLKSITFTTPTIEDGQQCGIIFNGGWYTGATVSSTFSNAMIEKGSTATSYEPYTGGQPSPSPDYPQEIQSATGTQKVVVSGKNILPITLSSQTINGLTITKNSDGSITLNGTTTATFNIEWKTNSITLSTGTYYIGLGTITNSFNLYFNKSGGGFEVLGNPASSSYYTLTLNEETTYTGLKSYVGSGITFNNVTFYPMITKTLPFNYQPYQEPQEVDIELDNIELNKIGTYEDYIDGTPDNWVLYKNIGKVVLDGSETYLTWGLKETNYFSSYVYKLTSNPAVINGQIISDYFPFSNYNVVANATNIGCFTGGTYIGVSIDKSLLSDTSTQANALASIKTWFTNNNSIFCYLLATETTETITDTNLISQLNELYYLQSYNDTTNIDVTGNLPMRITASAIKGE